MRRGLIAEEEEEDKSGPSWFVRNRVRSNQLPAFSHTMYHDVTWLKGCLINLAIASFMWFILQLDQYDISRNVTEESTDSPFLYSLTSLDCTGQRSSLMSPSSKQKRGTKSLCVFTVYVSSSEIHMMIDWKSQYELRISSIEYCANYNQRC